jgi:hypothetical protein
MIGNSKEIAEQLVFEEAKINDYNQTMQGVDFDTVILTLEEAL